MFELFWPELFKLTAALNNKAYSLFKDLFENSPLKDVFSLSIDYYDEDEEDEESYLLPESLQNQESFFGYKLYGGFTTHGLSCNCVSNSFFYSHYDKICSDIQTYSLNHFKNDFESLCKVTTKIENIRLILAKKFLKLYELYLKDYNSERIIHEHLSLKMTLQGVDKLTCDKEHFKDTGLQESELSSVVTENVRNNQGVKKKGRSHSIEDFNVLNNSFTEKNNQITFQHFQSNVFLDIGTLLNESMLYRDALSYLNQSLALHPNSAESYMERAISYFQLNEINKAIDDYSAIKKLNLYHFEKKTIFSSKDFISLSQENKIEFSKGLLEGCRDGGYDCVCEIIPSIKGLFCGIWCLACSPLDISQDFIRDIKLFVTFFKNNTTKEALKTLVPELRELCESWEMCGDYNRGKQIGYIIGKYGVDIFGTVGAVKTLKAYQNLRRANALFTIERCTISQANRAIVLNSCFEKKKKVETLWELSKKGKVIPADPNKVPHVMQSKHAWDKLIKLTGNQKQDFKTVIKLLEKEEILSAKNFKKETLINGSLKMKQFEKSIGSHKIVTTFIEDEGKWTFLTNAYVETK